MDSPGTDACPARLPPLDCMETFYVRQGGKGRDGKTMEGALGPAQFNDRRYWDDGAGKDGKIGPGDCVNILGTVTGPLVVQASGAPSHPIAIVGLDTDTLGPAQVVGSVPFNSNDYVWFRATGGNGVWVTDGSKPGERCGPTQRAGCSRPGIAASLGLKNCTVLWVNDQPARRRQHADFRWAAGPNGGGDRLILNNPDLISDPNTESVPLRCGQHLGQKINRNSCGAPAGLGKYFCEGYDFPPENFAIHTGDHSYVEIRSVRISYADEGIGFYSSVNAPKDDYGHNAVRCVTFKSLDMAGVFVERQHGGHDAVYDSAFYDTGDGIYVNHPDGGAGHAFCGNYFSGMNENARTPGDGHAIGLQEARDVTVEWNYIENARKPMELWAWVHRPTAFATTNVKIRYNHIVDPLAPNNDGRRPNDGTAITLSAGDAVYGNEVAYNWIENQRPGDAASLVVGLRTGGGDASRAAADRSATRTPNRFAHNTIIGAGTSILVGRNAAACVFEDNVSYEPVGMHVQLLQDPRDKRASFEHNLYYPVDARHAFELSGGTRLAFDKWQAMVGGEAQSLAVEPASANAE